jgi:hypothetical protein
MKILAILIFTGAVRSKPLSFEEQYLHDSAQASFNGQRFEEDFKRAFQVWFKKVSGLFLKTVDPLVQGLVQDDR